MTRIAVFSDIHGNAVALAAVLAELEHEVLDHVICLGDAIQGGPQPVAVVASLRKLACPVVMGNADAWLLTGKETGAEPIDPDRLRRMHEVREWSLSQLSAEDREFIARFVPTVEVPLGDGRNLLGFHGSPHSFDDILLPKTPDNDIERMLGGFAPHVLTGGHTHVQQIHHLGRSFYFGCGSVGFAYRHQQAEGGFKADPWAEYAILTADNSRLSLEFRRVPFDVEALIQIYQASSRPHAQESVAQYTYA